MTEADKAAAAVDAAEAKVKAEVSSLKPALIGVAVGAAVALLLKHFL